MMDNATGQVVPICRRCAEQSKNEVEALLAPPAAPLPPKPQLSAKQLAKQQPSALHMSAAASQLLQAAAAAQQAESDAAAQIDTTAGAPAAPPPPHPQLQAPWVGLALPPAAAAALASLIGGSSLPPRLPGVTAPATLDAGGMHSTYGTLVGSGTGGGLDGMGVDDCWGRHALGQAPGVAAGGQPRSKQRRYSDAGPSGGGGDGGGGGDNSVAATDGGFSAQALAASAAAAAAAAHAAWQAGGAGFGGSAAGVMQQPMMRQGISAPAAGAQWAVHGSQAAGGWGCWPLSQPNAAGSMFPPWQQFQQQIQLQQRQQAAAIPFIHADANGMLPPVSWQRGRGAGGSSDAAPQQAGLPQMVPLHALGGGWPPLPAALRSSNKPPANPFAGAQQNQHHHLHQHR